MLAHVALALATDAALVERVDGTAAKHELGGAVQLACLDWQRAQVARVAAEARLEWLTLETRLANWPPGNGGWRKPVRRYLGAAARRRVGLGDLPLALREACAQIADPPAVDAAALHVSIDEDEFARYLRIHFEVRPDGVPRDGDAAGSLMAGYRQRFVDARRAEHRERLERIRTLLRDTQCDFDTHVRLLLALADAYYEAGIIDFGAEHAACQELGASRSCARAQAEGWWRRAQHVRGELESWSSGGPESQWYQLEHRFGIALSAISVGEREQAATALDSLLASDPVGVFARRASVLAAALRGAPSSELVELADQQAKEPPGPELERARYALALYLLGMADLERGDAERARLMIQLAHEAQGELSWANVVRLPR